MTNHQALFQAQIQPYTPPLSQTAAEAWRLGYEAALLNTTNARHITNPFESNA